MNRTQRPTWCGQCDPATRLVTLGDALVGRCPACHPLRVTAAPAAASAYPQHPQHPQHPQRPLPTRGGRP